MKLVLQILRTVLIFLLLTIITQIGGIVYLLYKLGASRFKKQVFYFRLATFSFLYLVSTLVIIPPIAKYFGRVPLPYFHTETYPVKPANLIYCLFNRHYVRSPLKLAFQDIALQLKRKYPTIKLVYLDANFPFLDKFPLLPHRSHDDGKKLDISFLYLNDKKQWINQTPNFLGYGFCETPQKGEINQAAICKNRGYWQYDLLRQITFNVNKDRYHFDERGNTALLKIIAKHKSIGKILLEPHLKKRLGLSNYYKIRFHGCAAVRHDDHIHIQL